MKEKLLQLGLTEEMADKVLAEIALEKEAAGEREKQLTAELSAVNAQLMEANKTIKSYKDMKIEDIKASAEGWEEKAKALEAQLKSQKEDALLDKALSTVGAQDTEILKQLLDKAQLSFGADGVAGLEEQIKELRGQKAYLFKPEEEKSQYQGYQPEKSTGTGVSEMQAAIEAAFKN